uniref:Uncharacterized protein n=1 Tax=Ixodes ricinus TaxID=34613 RepID=A0A090X9Q3_IXORI
MNYYHWASKIPGNHFHWACERPGNPVPWASKRPGNSFHWACEKPSNSSREPVKGSSIPYARTRGCLACHWPGIHSLVPISFFSADCTNFMHVF